MLKQPYDLGYYLIKSQNHAEILEAKPQCENCEHLNFWTFSSEYYKNTVSVKYCPICPKYDGKKHKFTINQYV